MSWGTSARHAMVFQQPVMLRRSVRANVDYALARAGIRGRARRARREAALACTGLSDFARRQALTLSGGERQRLALARAWAPAPQVLFLDEPTASLDPAATHAVEAILRTMQGEGTTLMVATHDLAQARRLGGRLLFLHGGRVGEQGETAAFLAGPNSPDGAAFVEGRLTW